MESCLAPPVQFADHGLKYNQPKTHDGELFRVKGVPIKGYVLCVQRDFRSDCVSIPFMMMMAAAEAGWIVKWEDPWKLVSPGMRGPAFEMKVPVPLKLSERAASGNFDIIVVNNFPVDWDCNDLPSPSVFIYDEPWKGVVFPDGAEYCMTYKDGWRLLNEGILQTTNQPVNPRRVMDSVRRVTFDCLKASIFPPVWPDYLDEDCNCVYINRRDALGDLLYPQYPEGAAVTTVKDIPLAYNGMLRDDWSNQMMKVAKQRLTKYAKDHLGCLYWFEPGLPVVADKPGEIGFLDVVPRCKAALHYSASDLDHWDGVGQGAYENMVAGAVTFEYPFNAGAVKEGLVDYQSVLYFNDERELQEKWDWLQSHPEEGKRIARNGREVAMQHTYKILSAHIDKFFSQIQQDNVIKGRKCGKNAK